MDKDKIIKCIKEGTLKLYKSFSLFREYCNNYFFPSSLIIIGLFTLLLNIINIGVYRLLTLGGVFIALYFFFNRHWFYSLIGSFLMAIGTFYILLLSYILPDGGEVAIVIAFGLGFVIFYGIEGKWKEFWPLIPGITVSFFGFLLYLHQTEKYNIAFLPHIIKLWPLIIILFGIISLFSKSIKKQCILILKKIKEKTRGLTAR